MNADDEANLAVSPSAEEAQLVARLEQYRQAQREQGAARRRQKKQQRVLFVGSWLLSLLWLLLWALGVSGVVRGWQPFMLVAGSVILVVLLSFALWALWRLMQKVEKMPESTLSPWEEYIRYYLAKVDDDERRYSSGTETTAMKAMYKSRLLKLQEQIHKIGNATLEWQQGDSAVLVSNLELGKQIAQQPMHTQIRGIVVELRLPTEVRNNAVFFSIHNEQQHFDSLSFNAYILGDNEVRRLVKEHDQRIAHELVDKFNRHFLLVGRNPAWLVDNIDESAVSALLQLDESMQHNVRIEIDSDYVRAFLPYADFLAMPTAAQPFTAQLLREHLAGQLAQLDALAQDLRAIVRDIYGF